MITSAPITDEAAGVQLLWVPRRVPSLNDLLQAKSTVYGNGVRRDDAYAHVKKSWENDVALLARQARLRPVKAARMHYELHETDRKRDPSNIAAAAIKFVEDGLVKAGVLPGDGWKHVLSFSVTWRVGVQAGVMVRIEEVRS